MREIAPFGLRMRPELKRRLTDAAQHNGRSLNAEIVTRLEDSFVVGSHVKAAGTIGGTYPLSAQDSGVQVSATEHDMLSLFRSWSTEKQLSFLVLFK